MAYALFEKVYFEALGVSDIGRKRDENQDAVMVSRENGCFAVSDGMGGGDGGAQASRMVVDALKMYLRKRHARPGDVARAIYAANDEIVTYSLRNQMHGMGATAVVLALNGFQPGDACVIHAGDSRAYRLRGKKLEVLTQDHTYVQAVGQTVGDAKLDNCLLNAVGMGENFFVDVTKVAIDKDDMYLLCSDGLYRQVSEKRICETMLSHETLETKCGRLVEMANHAGGIDNVSVVLVKIVELPAVTEDVLVEKSLVDNEVDKRDNATPPTR